MLHDQVTATIAPEYFTRFKFIQFHIDPNVSFRIGVALVGFFATWWTGAVIGLLLGLTGFIFPDHITMKAALHRSLLLTLLITALMGCCGFIYGRYIQDPEKVNWWLPYGIRQKNHFILVGNIHNFSYLGGLTGAIAGIAYLVKRDKKVRRMRQSGKHTNT
jgi:hypothetical protein